MGMVLKTEPMQEPFVWKLRVYWEDTDAGGVIYHSRYLNFFERARTEWLRSLGVDQSHLLNEERRMFVVTETRAEFVSPARFNDQVVVTARLANLNRATFDIEQNIYLNSIDDTLLLRGGVKAAFLNADTMRPMRVPAEIFEDPQT